MPSSVFLVGALAAVGFFAAAVWYAGAGRRAHDLARQLTRDHEHTTRALAAQIAEAQDTSRALRESEARWRQIVETEPECVSTLGPDGSLQQLNAAGLRIFEAAAFRDVAGMQMLSVVSPEHRADFQALTAKVFRGESATCEFEMTGLRGTRRWLTIHAAPLRDEAGTVVSLLGISHDISERRRTEGLLRWETQALERIMQPGTLGEVLDDLMRGLEASAPDAICSVLLLDETGTRLVRGGAPSLPHAYNDAIDGVTIGPRVGSCGTAAHLDRQVIVADIATDPLWIDFRALALAHGLRACWSTPVHSEAGRVLGTFAVYYREPRLPSTGELEIIERAQAVVAIAIVRRQSEAALIASQQRYEVAVLGSSDGLWDWDMRTGQTYFSPRWKAMLGFDDHELPNDYATWQRLIHPDDLAATMGALDAYVSGSSTHYAAEFRMTCRDGSHRWILARGTVLRDEHGQPFRMAGSHTDITERRRSEEALRASQQMVTTIIDTIPVRVFWKDRQLTFLGCNTEFALDAGFASPADVVGRDDFQMAWRTEAERYRSDDRKVLESGLARLLIEEPQTTPDGRTLTLLTSKVPIRNAHGEVTGVLGTYLDITARKQAEEAVKRLAAFPEVNPNPVMELTGSGAVTYTNAAATALSHGLGLTDPARMLPADSPAIVRECLATGRERLRLEQRIGKRVLSWSFYPIAERGVVHGYAADITERLTLEDQLRQSQKMEAIGQLAGGVAHDFNNILSVVMMQAEVSAAAEGLPAEALEGLQEIQACAERGADLTRQLLLFSRRQVMQPRHLNLNDVVTTLAKMLQRIIGEDVSLELHLHTSRLTARADAGMLDQVLLNLAVNARDAMPKGGRLRVETWEETVAEDGERPYPDVLPGRYVGMSVSDTGCGITPEVLPRIFEPFFTTKEAGQGTGLGLATVFGIVRQHGGWVTVTSEPGEGTTFRIFLPATNDSAETRERARPVPRGGTETVLVVEDEPSVRMLVRVILQRRGYTVIEAATGVEALTIWDAHRAEVSLVLTDLVMPDGVSGQELARRLRADTPGLRVLFSSGYSPDIAGRELRLGSGDTFLQKPFSADRLAEMVRHALDTPPAV